MRDPGRGARLHGGGLAQTSQAGRFPSIKFTGLTMELVESRPTASGIVIQTYRPVGRPTFGTLG